MKLLICGLDKGKNADDILAWMTSFKEELKSVAVSRSQKQSNILPTNYTTLQSSLAGCSVSAAWVLYVRVFHGVCAAPPCSLVIKVRLTLRRSRIVCVGSLSKLYFNLVIVYCSIA